MRHKRERMHLCGSVVPVDATTSMAREQVHNRTSTARSHETAAGMCIYNTISEGGVTWGQAAVVGSDADRDPGTGWPPLGHVPQLEGELEAARTASGLPHSVASAAPASLRTCRRQGAYNQREQWEQPETAGLAA